MPEFAGKVPPQRWSNPERSSEGPRYDAESWMSVQESETSRRECCDPPGTKTDKQATQRGMRATMGKTVVAFLLCGAVSYARLTG